MPKTRPPYPADVPDATSYEATGATVKLNSFWFVGLRLFFDWRYYW